MDAVGRGRRELIGQRPRESMWGAAGFTMSLRLCWRKGIDAVLSGDWGSRGRSLLSEEDKRFTVGGEK